MGVLMGKGPSACPPEQYGSIVSLYSHTCIISSSLFLMLDCVPLRTADSSGPLSLFVQCAKEN